jgi:asparagine synthase (glutamine-hydrolysing)
MCGILGFNFADRSLAHKMVASMDHRGPDHSAIIEDEGLTLGYTRLGIIDLKNGNQPLLNEDGSLLVFFNGEIYNHKDLKERFVEKGHRYSTDTDTESIIHAYEEYGKDCLQYLKGMFSFVLYDKGKKELFIARDRLGIKPLYYYMKKGVFVFASEIKAIMEYDQLEKAVNIPALSGYLTYRYCPGKSTFMQDIMKLEPAHYLTYKNGQISIKRYWNLSFDITNYSREFYLNRYHELMDRSVSDCMISDVPVGLLLSGGIDSSTIAALARNPENLDTFTVGFDGGTENEFDSARQVSDEFGTRHHEITLGPSSLKHLRKVIWHLDEPIADPTSIPNYILAAKAEKYVKVLINGDGADEIFCGYEQYKIMKFREAYNRIPHALRTRITDAFSGTKEPFFLKLKDFLHHGNTGAKTYSSLISIFGNSEAKMLLRKYLLGKVRLDDYTKRADQLFSHAHDHLNKMSYHDIITFLPDNMLVKFDKMTMASSVEGRVPFCDHQVAEFAASLPPRYKLNRTTDKYIMRESMRGILPDSIIKKKKQRFFVPTDNWFDREYADYAENLFESKRETAEYYFEKDYTKKLLSHKKLISNSLLGMNRLTRLYYSRQLWTLTNFLEWHDIFIDGEKVVQ